MYHSTGVQKLSESQKSKLRNGHPVRIKSGSGNNLHLTEREIQLIAFTSIKGNITYANVREEFCKLHNTTSPTINNIISKLKKIGIFVKEAGKVKVNPVIVLNFNSDLTLEIKIVHE